MPKYLSIIDYVIWLALIAPAVEVLSLLERLGCPADAFICGSASGPKSWLGLAGIGLLIVFLGYPAKILLYLVSRNALLRRQFDAYYGRFSLRKTAFRAALVACLTLPALYLLTYEKIWASPSAIVERKYVWSEPIKRSWSDIVTVTSWCRPGLRGSWDEGYELAFGDGGSVDLATSVGPISERKAEIFAALRGRHFVYDSAAIDKGCPSDFRDMATQYP